VADRHLLSDASRLRTPLVPNSAARRRTVTNKVASEGPGVPRLPFVVDPYALVGGVIGVVGLADGHGAGRVRRVDGDHQPVDAAGHAAQGNVLAGQLVGRESPGAAAPRAD